MAHLQVRDFLDLEAIVLREEEEEEEEENLSKSRETVHSVNRILIIIQATFSTMMMCQAMGRMTFHMLVALQAPSWRYRIWRTKQGGLWQEGPTHDPQ